MGNQTVTDKDTEFYQELAQHPLLTSEEEQHLIPLTQQGDAEAMDKLIRCNLRLISKIARKFPPQAMPHEDLMQEGVIGLMNAAARWQPERGLKFSTYATWWILSAIERALQDKSRLIRLPSELHKTGTVIKQGYADLTIQLQREPTAVEVAEYLDLPLNLLHHIANNFPKSLNAEIEHLNGSTTPVEELMRDTSPTAEESINDLFPTPWLERVLNLLPEHESTVLAKSYGLAGRSAMPIATIAKEHNMSQEKIRQIIKFSKARLRHPALASRLYDAAS